MYFHHAYISDNPIIRHIIARNRIVMRQEGTCLIFTDSDSAAVAMLLIALLYRNTAKSCSGNLLLEEP
jgi:hypothetical protein